MSKQKVIVLSVVQQGLTKAEAARRYGVGRQWVHELVRRYEHGGLDAVEPRSKRPRASPHATPKATTQRIRELRAELTKASLDAGPQTIAWHLEQEGLKAPSTSTIRRTLVNAGLITPEPKKRPKSSLHRFEAAQPNETWQSDFTHWTLDDGTDVEILNFLDDHSRYLLSCTGYRPVTGSIVVQAFLATTEQYGLPASTLTDNGLVYTARFAGGKGGRNAFENLLHTLNITQKNGPPGHPQTQGKIERFHQTLKRWLHGQPPAPTLQALNQQLHTFQRVYNHQRPHRALNRRTPAQAYQATPKASPNQPKQGGHWRIRVDRIDAAGKVTLRYNGRLHHIGIGRAYARQTVLMLVHDREVMITTPGTGEILRELTIDPTRNYQSRQKKTPPAEAGGVVDVATHM